VDHGTSPKPGRLWTKRDVLMPKIFGKDRIMIVKVLLGLLIGAGIGAALGHFGKCSSGTCPLTANPYRGAFFGAALGVIVALGFSRGSNVQSPHPDRSMSEHTPVTAVSAHAPVHIDSEADFNTKVLETNGICLVDLFSNRCPPCHALAPTISSLAKKYAGRATVCKVNVDDLPALAGRYRVSAIPTVLILKDGKVQKRLVGLRQETEYSVILDKLVNEEQ